jgi:uncharacterized protein with von Willebrand factor type A (vWA) domain
VVSKSQAERVAPDPNNNPLAPRGWLPGTPRTGSAAQRYQNVIAMHECQPATRLANVIDQLLPV